MAHIIPFKGILYDQKKIKDISLIVTPPYDVISPKKQHDYYQQSPFNIVRLILGKENKKDNKKDNKYVRSRNYFNEWKGKGVFCRDKKPALYFHTQTYRLENNQKKVRRGFITLVKIEDFESGVVLPHEQTFKKVTSSRLELMRKCKANFSQVFTLYSDKENRVNKLLAQKRSTPDIELKDEEGSIHRLWKITDPSIIGKVKKKLKNKPLFIADGHHRYETALRYRNERKKRSKKFTGKEPFNYIMMYLTNMDDSGLTVLPTHRLIKNFPVIKKHALENRLNQYFWIKKFPFRNKKQELTMRKKLINEMGKDSHHKHLFGLLLHNSKSFYLLTLKDRKKVVERLEHGKPREWAKLDVVILHYLILHTILKVKEEDISYVKETDIPCQLVNKGRAKAFVILNSTKVSQVREIASLGERMPHKSTYFYPKILTGLVINSQESS